MAKGHLGPVLRYLRRVIGEGPDETGDLLERFVARRDDCAFAGLVERYGPMVFNVCQRVLGDPHDAEDAFQATFLVLARKAGSVRSAAALGGWLYRVAYHLAVEARAKAARRRNVENDAPPPESPDPDAGSAWRDVQPLLDEELQRLPDKYLAPIRLHYLEGKTTEEAAKQLGCPKGTLLSRLDRARDLLRERLARRGVGVSTAALAAALAENAASAAPLPELLESTGPAALEFAAGRTGGLAPDVVELANGALRNMLQSKVRMAAALAASAVFLAGGAGLLLHQALAGNQEKPKPALAPADTKPEPFQVSERGTIEGIPTGATLSRDGRHLAVQFTDPARQRNFNGMMINETSVRVVDVASLKTIYTTPAPSETGMMALQVGPEGKFLVAPSMELDKLFGDGGNPFGGAGGGGFAPPAGGGAVPFGGAGGGLGFPGFGAMPNPEFVVWDVEKKKARFKLPETTCAAQLTNDGQSLVTLNTDGEIKVLTVSTGKEKSACRTGIKAGGMVGVQIFVLASDGKTVALSSVDELFQPTLHLWSLATGRQLPGEPKPALGVWTATSLAFSADGKVLAMIHGSDLLLWDVAAGKEIDLLKAGKDGAAVRSVLFSPDGRSLAATCQGINGFGGRGAPPAECEIIVWDSASRRERLRVPAGAGRGGYGNALAFSPDGKVLAWVEMTGGREVGVPVEQNIRLIETGSGKELATLPEQAGIIGFAPRGQDGCLLLTIPGFRQARAAAGGGFGGFPGAAEWNIKVWELRGGTLSERPELRP